jgi:hypothetical protein
VKKILLSGLFLAFTTISFAQNLISDPGAEADPIANGWTIVTQGSNCYGSANWRIPGNQNGYPSAQQGTYYFFSGCNNISGEVYQDVNVSSYSGSIDGGKQSFTFSGYVQVFDQTPSDSARMIIEYRSSTSTILDKYDIGYTGNRAVWTQYVNTKTAPAGTRTIRIRLLSKNVNGTSVDAYFDNLSLTTTVVLPVRLLSFTANLQADNTVKLNWETASEINNDKFTVERSAYGINWFTVTNIAAGNSSVGQRYSYVDITALQGITYYRLKQTDLSGQINYSAISIVNRKAANGIFIYPNPVTGGTLNIEVKKEVIVYLYSAVGSQLMVKTLTAGKHAINVSTLPKGTYFIRTTGQPESFIIK